MPDKTVLVVEDDDLNMKLVREVLRLGQSCPNPFGSRTSWRSSKALEQRDSS